MKIYTNEYTQYCIIMSPHLSVCVWVGLVDFGVDSIGVGITVSCPHNVLWTIG